MEDRLYLTWWLNLVTDKRFLSNDDINDEGNTAIQLGKKIKMQMQILFSANL